jgi:hypothetical protein
MDEMIREKEEELGIYDSGFERLSQDEKAEYLESLNQPYYGPNDIGLEPPCDGGE